MKREPLIIIDGYNLMHQLVASRTLGAPRGLERARNLVIQRIQKDIATNDFGTTTVVFDANSGEVSDEEASESDVAGRIQIEFAVNYPDADSMIEEMIRRHSSPSRLTVVSSDRRLIDAARRKGAEGIDCQAWLDRQEELRAGKNGPAANENESDQVPNATVDPDESRYWMRKFGYDPPE